jgi:hypothetical protein
MDRNQIIADYLDYIPISKIFIKHGISCTSFYKILDASGIERRPKRVKPKNQKTSNATSLPKPDFAETLRARYEPHPFIAPPTLKQVMAGR